MWVQVQPPKPAGIQWVWVKVSIGTGDHGRHMGKPSRGHGFEC